MAKRKKSYNLILYELQQEAVRQEALTGRKVASDVALQKQAEEEYIAPIKNVNPANRTNSNVKIANVDQKSLKKADKNTFKRTWLSKGAFDDGYQIGDITKTLLGTTADIGVGVTKGVTRIGEGLFDLGSYGVAGVSDFLGNDDFAEKVKKKAQENTTDKLFKPSENFVDKYSIIGEKGDSVTEGLGYVGAILATGGVAGAAGLGTLGTTAVTTGLTGLSSMGSGMSEAYQGGATDDEAFKYGIIAGVAEAGSELIFGGLGKAVNAVGLSKGLSSLDDALAKKISNKLTSTLSKNLAEYTVKAGAEGVEEVISGIAQGIGKKMTYMSDEELVQILKDENLLEQFIVGTVTSSIAQAPGLVKTTRQGRDFISNYTQNEQKVVDAEVENRVNEQQKAGKELTNKEISNIRKQVEQDFEKGYVSTDTIENTLGKKLTTEQEADLEAQLNTLLQQSKTETDPKQIAQIQQQMDMLEEQLNTSRNIDFSNDAFIQKSYQEKELRSQTYKADITKYDAKQQKIIQKAIDSGILNDTRKTHEFVDMLAKIAADKDISFDFSNNEKLKASGFAVEGKTIDGFVSKDSITLNIDSNKALNKVVGHEITHILEGTELYTELQKAVKEYATTKGIWNSRLAEITDRYKSVEGANVENELTSDLVGEYLFTDTDFVNNLSATKPNVFKRIYNEIKYLLKVATAGSTEARQLEKVKRTFEKAYKAQGTQTSTDTKYSVSDNQGRTLTKEQQEYFKDSKVRDENGNLVKVYHGTNKAGFTEFKRNINYFTDNKAVAQTYTGNDGIYEGYVNITNPITVDAAGEIWSKIAVDNISIDGINDVREFLNTYGASTWQEDGKLRTSTADLVSAIEEAIDEGEIVSDGVIIKNIYDEGGYSDSVGGKLGTDYITFNSNQFKNVDNTNPTTDPDIRYSLSEDGKMVDNKGNEVKLEAAEAGTHGTLMAIHNLNEQKLRGAAEIGGFAFPSIAITNPSKINHSHYGSISVLFDKSTIDPANKKNKVYSRDGYTPRFPKLEYKANSEVIKGLRNRVNNLGNYVSNRYVSDANSFLNNIEDYLDNRGGIEGLVDAAKNQESLKYLYIKENNIPFMEQYKEEAYSRVISNELLQKFLDNYKGNKDTLNQISSGELYDNLKSYIEQLYIEEHFKTPEEKAFLEEHPSLKPDLNYGSLYDVAVGAYKLHKYGSNQIIDTTKTNELINNTVNEEEYETWLRKEFKDMVAKKGLRNNKDYYTPAGNPRSFEQLHEDYNLDNVIKIMEALNDTGSEHAFVTGINEIAGNASIRFDSIAEIKATEDLIQSVSEEKYSAILEDLGNRLRDVEGDIIDRGHENSSNPFMATDNLSQAIAVMARKFGENKRVTSSSIINELNEWGFHPTQEEAQTILDMFSEMRKLPTEYFEAKPKRAVRFDEVEAVVVPNDMNAELKQELYDKGLNVVEYDPNIEGDRQAKINEFDDLKFSLSAQNEEIAPTGNWNVRGEEVRLQVEEAIAPLQETITNLTEQVQTLQENIAPEATPVQEVKPTQPTLEEVQNLMDIRDNKSGSEYARAFFVLRDKYGQVELYKSLNEYYSTGTVTQPSNVGNIDTAPVRQDIVEKQGQEAFNNITDNDAPSFEDVAADAVWDIPFESDNSTEIEAKSPLDNRDIDEVGNRKIKAYQYENPEVKPFFQTEAQNMLYDLDNTIKGERGAAIDELGNMEYYGITRQTTEAIAYLKDNYGYSYDQIRQGLNKIIEDDGKENNAVSKRIEFMLDERLREGYTTSDGIPIPANEDYIKFLNEKQITEYNKEAFNAITDEDIPLYEKIEPRQSATTGENTQVQQTTPIKRATAQNGNTDVSEAKQRKWVKTSTESEVVNREILPDDLDQTKIFYQPITNKATLDTANVKLDSLGYEKAVEYFNNQMLNKTVKVEDIALGERLIQEAIKNKDTKTAGELIQDIAILGTELGQKVQALSIIQRMTPEGQLKMLEKTINRGKAKGDKAFTDTELTDDMRKKILDTYNKDGSYDKEALDKAVEDVKQEIADQMPSTMLDKVNAWRYFSMLGNPKTHIRNLVSNVAMKGTTAVKNAVARTIETIAPIENRTRTWKAASEDVTAYAKQTALEMKDVISGDSKYSEATDIKAKRETFKNKVLEKLTSFNSDLLEKEDWWFSKGAFENSFREFLTANGIETKQDIENNPELIQKGKNYAVEQAQIATFRQYSWLSNKIRDIENKNTATSMAVGAILPFKKTPINIAKAGLSYSPLGFAKTLTYDVSQVKKGNMEASTLIDHIAQNTTGTALTLVGYMLAQSGFLNGAGDDDKEGKYDYQLGKQAYSINIGGNTYSLSWLSPVAMPLFVGANAYEQLVEGEEWNADVVLETLGQTLDPLSEMSFLSSLDSVLSSYDSGVQRFFGIGEAMAQNYITQFVPTASSQLAATLDDTKRSTKVSGDSTMKVLEETYNKLIYKIPGLRETLEPSTDIWGNEIKQSEDLFTRAFENFIAPYARKDSIATEIDEELKDLYRQTGDNGILPSIPYNYVNYDGEKYNMSAKEYTDYKKTYGQTANDLLEDLFRTTTYQNATSEERADMVNDVYDYARDEAKLEYLGKEGVDYTNTTEEGAEVYKENLIKGAIENDMTVEEYGLYVDDPEEYSFLKEKDYSYRRKYFDTSDSLKKIEESFTDKKEGVDDEDELDAIYTEKKTSIINNIINSGLEDTEKASLYKRYYNSDTVDTIVKSAISIDDYLTYETKEFKADKNAKGNSIPGSRKDKVIDYVNTLDMEIGQKAILIKSTNTFKFNDYNEQIVRYVDSLGLPYDDVVSILKDLDMTVDDEGNVYWD